jgi:hypothetical protein
MNPLNKATLDKHYHHWITLRDAQYMRGLNIHERADMVRVLREEFRPGYSYDEWCPTCIADMVRTLYQEYDKWVAGQPEPKLINLSNIESIPSINEEEIFNAHKVPAELFGVAATFPQHDKCDTAPSVTSFSDECSVDNGTLQSITIITPESKEPTPDPIFEQSEEVKKVVNKNHKRK